MADIKTLATQANVDITHAGDVIQQIYRQVFGNKHLMELDINPSLEALFMNGDMNVQEFVYALAQSETYKRMFLEPNSQYRFVELNFKHLLGRPPRDQSELMEHVRLFADEGYESEIASYIYNEEYLSVFGLDKVPYNRASESIKGGTTIGYTRAAILDPGYAGFDGSTQKGDAEIKNITPTAKVRDITDSCLQYFLIKIILQAKKKPAMIGKICKSLKFSDHGSKISKAPKLPNIRAKKLHKPILSLRNIIANKDTKIWNV